MLTLGGKNEKMRSVGRFFNQEVRLKKLMLSAAMLAMVLAAGVPALAQSSTPGGDGNVACVQAAVQNEVDKTQVNEMGDNINVQEISQACNVAVEQVNTVVNNISGSASASASASTATKAQYPTTAQYSSASAPSAAQYQYSGGALELPSTGGSSLIALGVGVLLVVGGLLARKIVR